MHIFATVLNLNTLFLTSPQRPSKDTAIITINYDIIEIITYTVQSY